MGQTYLINSIAYIPRQDGQSNGNVGEHQILLSVDNSTWTLPAFGTYQDSNSTKTTIFAASYARYVRLIALTEAGNRGPWTSCASFNIFETNTPAPATGEGEWSPTVSWSSILTPMLAILITRFYSRSTSPLYPSLLQSTTALETSYCGHRGLPAPSLEVPAKIHSLPRTIWPQEQCPSETFRIQMYVLFRCYIFLNCTPGQA